jgi:hypothetical protein
MKKVYPTQGQALTRIPSSSARAAADIHQSGSIDRSTQPVGQQLTGNTFITQLLEHHMDPFGLSASMQFQTQFFIDMSSMR